jgi:septal ring factor EnvC (AmiA/AmiB activator)
LSKHSYRFSTDSKEWQLRQPRIRPAAECRVETLNLELGSLNWVYRSKTGLKFTLTRLGLKTKLKHEVFEVRSAMPFDNIDQLEGKINRLIENHERVKKEKASIEKKLAEKESEWHHLQGQIRRYERERIELREKINKIIGQLANMDISD